MVIKICENCREEKEHHAKGLCYSCYKKINWVPKLHNCKRCKRELPIHAKGLCASCYNFLFHSDTNKAYRQRKLYGIDLKTYKKITQKCAICGFDKIVDIHFIDGNKKNISLKNLVGLCPNHHRMVNNSKYRLEVWLELKKQGFDIPLQDKTLP